MCIDVEYQGNYYNVCEILLRLYYASLLCGRLERSLQCLTSVLFYLRALLEEGNKTEEINILFLEFFSLSLSCRVLLPYK